jgi:antirestriction protein
MNEQVAKQTYETNQEKEEQPKAESEQMHSLSPKIYVASLSDYNAGTLHGEWIDAGQTADEIQAEISTMLAASEEPGAEEWAIHDYEDFGAIRLHEYESISMVAAISCGLTKHGAAFGHWAEYCRTEGDRTSLLADLERFEGVYLGHWESEEAFAQSMLEDYDFEAELDRVLPPSLRQYVSIDIRAFAADVISDLHIAQDQDGVHVFQTGR